MTDAELPAQFQEVEGTQYVGLVAQARIVDAGTDSRFGCKVDDGRKSAIAGTVQKHWTQEQTVLYVDVMQSEPRIFQEISQTPTYQRRSVGVYAAHARYAVS